MRFMVTGGAGFIGSAVVRRLVSGGAEVLNIDKLTYAGDLRSVVECQANANYRFQQADIADGAAMAAALGDFSPDRLIHLAAESHVDRSIDGPAAFLHTNVIGTFALLEAALAYWRKSAGDFRFIHVSTDEVYGSLGPRGLFSETSAYAPNSPYSASKASADHLARAWGETYGVPVLITNCSNNYGPFQHPEKLIPTVIRSALSGKPIPIYGKGENVRDWIYVEDHVSGLLEVAAKGRPGQKYNLGGAAETSNLELARRVCALLDEVAPRCTGSYADLLTFVADRPGHDFRYAIDSAKAEAELGWVRDETLDSGLRKTVNWYLDHRDWLESVTDEGRLGLKPPMS
jgi:dTDP-glucose 4,6-dehydratase